MVPGRKAIGRVVAPAFAALLGSAGLAAAQEAHAGKFSVGVGAGPAVASMTAGDAQRSRWGLALHGRAGADLSVRLALTLEADVQPFEVENPKREEAFRSSYLLLGLQPRLSRSFYVRPALGVQLRQWSGVNPVTSSDAGPALGVSGGYTIQAGRRASVAAELFWRSALIEVEGGVSARLAGLRAVASMRP